MRIAVTLLLVIALWGAYKGYTNREIHRAPGQIAPDAPWQRNVENAAPFQVNAFTLTPRAKFSMTARVLASERYRADAASALVPIDIAFGWGAMSDSAVINRLKISQSGRFYFWRYENNPPAPVEAIIRSSANMHLIPADSVTRDRLFSARVGDVLELEGDLVDAARIDGWRMSTSLTREDSGAGACEVIYVRHVIVRAR